MTLHTDLPIPRMCDIVARARDYRDSAVRQGDTQTAERINRMVREKLPNARLCWTLGTLIVRSPSGNTYHVSNAGCNCLNGQAGKRECWHWHLHQTLLDMHATEAEDNDAAADIGALFAERLAATARVLADMRRAQGGRRCSIWV